MFGLIFEKEELAVICGEIISAYDFIDHFEVVIEYEEYHQNKRASEKVRTNFIVRDVITDCEEKNYVQSLRKKIYSGKLSNGSHVIAFVRFGDILHLEGRAYAIKSYGEISLGEDRRNCAIIGEVMKMEEKYSDRTGREFLNIVLYIGTKNDMPEEVVINITGDNKIAMALEEIHLGDKVCFKSTHKPFYSNKSGKTYYEANDYLVVEKGVNAMRQVPQKG